MPLVALALASLVVAAPPCVEATDLSPELRAQQAVAVARARARAHDPAGARICVDRALALDPKSTLAWRTRAEVALALGDPADAAEAADRAASLGDDGPETALLAALAAAETGRGQDAVARAAAAGWEGTLVAASLDDPRAAYRAGELLTEPTARGALAGLVLAAHQGRAGHRDVAERLLSQARRNARRAAAPNVVLAAGRLQEELQAQGRWSFGALARSTVDLVANPAYTAPEDPAGASSVRLAVLAAAGARAPLGPVRFEAGVRLRQHVLLARRSRFCCLDLNAYSLSAAARLPLSADPSLVVASVALRWTDVFADAFRLHYASTLEGGPTLDLRLGAAVSLHLGLLGTFTDFVSFSPNDAQVSSLNRDRIGQRAVLGVAFRQGWFDARLEGVFLNDDADGDAFDALGGGIAVRLSARPAKDLTIHTGGSFVAREYGPVGDSAVIGAAATRTELRALVEVGAAVRLAPHLELLVEDVWISTDARERHRYAENILSVGVQTRW